MFGRLMTSLKFQWLVKLLVILSLAEFGYCSGSSGSFSKPRLGCYYQTWAVGRPGNLSYSVDDIPIDKCTHVMYSFIGLNETSWTVQVLNPGLDVDGNNFRKFLNLKQRNPEVSLGISIGGWGEFGTKYSDMVSVQNRRAVFIESVVEFLEEYPFDFLDIDWEYPGGADRGGRPEDKQGFLELVRELRQAFNSFRPGLELTMAVPVTASRLQAGYDVPELCNLMDAVHLMTYDLRTQGATETIPVTWADHSTPLHRRSSDEGIFRFMNAEDGAKLWRDEGCPSSKIVLGTAFYGRTLKLVNPARHEVMDPISEESPGFIDYFDICRNLQNRTAGWTREWDDEAKVPFMWNSNGNWITYDDAESLQLKMNHLKEMGYGGVMMWSVDSDDHFNLCGEKDILLNVLYNSLQNYTIPV